MNSSPNSDSSGLPKARIAAQTASDGQNVQRDGFGEELRQPLLVAGHVILRELVRGRAGDGEIDEGDDGEQPRGRIIDRDFLGRAEMLERQDVDIGQQQIEASRRRKSASRWRARFSARTVFGPAGTLALRRRLSTIIWPMVTPRW